jgi:hypothetical protein
MPLTSGCRNSRSTRTLLPLLPPSPCCWPCCHWPLALPSAVPEEEEEDGRSEICVVWGAVCGVGWGGWVVGGWVGGWGGGGGGGGGGAGRLAPPSAAPEDGDGRSEICAKKEGWEHVNSRVQTHLGWDGE